MKTKQEKFKAVDYMRKKREELSQLQKENPKEFEKQLAIRKKYASKLSQKKRNMA